MLAKILFWQESLPPEYARIFAFDNFSRTKKHVLAKALDMEQETDGCIPVGAYARLYIKDVSAGVASKLCRLASKMPVIASGLLQHESKFSVLNFRLPILSLFSYSGSIHIISYHYLTQLYWSLALRSMTHMMLLLKQKKNSFFTWASANL